MHPTPSTNEVLSQTSLHEKTFSLDHILNTLPYGVMVLDVNRNILFINHSGSLLFGNPDIRDYLMKRVDLLIVNFPVDLPAVDKGIEISERTECIGLRKNGEEVPLLVTISLMKSESEIFTLASFADISERKKKLADLNETRRQFQTLIENLPGVVYRCRNDRNWTMEYLSQGCLELTGYPAMDVMNNHRISYWDLIHPEDRERIWKEVQEQLPLRKPFTLEYRLITREGKTHWIWEKTKGIYDESDRLLHLEGFLSDVTESIYAGHLQEVVFQISAASYTSKDLDEFYFNTHKALGKIIDVENFFIAIYNPADDTISLPYQVDSKDRFATFPAGKTMTGYVIRTGKPLLAARERIEELAAAGHIEIIGSPASVWLGVPLIVEGSVFGVITVQSYTDPKRYTTRDLELLTFVADQLATMISRKTAEESLLKEKALMDQLFEGSPEAIIQIDNDGRVVKLNSEFSKLFGYQKDEILGKNLDDFIADAQYRTEAIRITSELTQGTNVEVETKRMHKDGHLIDVSLMVTPIYINQKICGGYGIYRDITFRKMQEKALIQAKEKAEGADKLKSAFLSNMSHEIRTPMNAILGFSALLGEPGLSDEEREEFIGIIKDRSNDLMRIIDDIIDISKIESGQISFEIKEFQVNMLMNSLLVTMNEVKKKTNKEHISLNCFPGNLTPEFKIMTDGNRLRQIMTNLIENALKFTEKGHVDFGYALKSEGNSARIEFFVRDTGIGIPKNMHSIIFERFRQVEESATRKFGGTGLGLTISRNLTRLLGGEIRLESDSGKGTTFYVSLPLLSSGLEEIRETLPRPGTVSSQKWQQKELLIVEDEESNYYLLTRLLKSTGVKITWCRNGHEAIEQCNLRTFDLILMDIRMPIMDGYETTVELRKRGVHSPIIAQTAYALIGERDKSLEAGCNNYIAKPIDISELLTILGIYLNK